MEETIWALSSFLPMLFLLAGDFLELQPVSLLLGLADLNHFMELRK